MEECMITAWTNRNIPPQTGRRILATGANSGIGYEAALELARAGAEVTLISRSEEKAQDARNRIWKVVPQARLELGLMDLSNPRSVRKFAQRQLASDRPINVLINNAGSWRLEKGLLAKTDTSFSSPPMYSAISC